jgi:predicted nucleic-acid-binding protein
MKKHNGGGMRRIAVDTNILVRLFTRDDGNQSQVAERLLAENVWIITPTVLLESEWVLRSKFRFSRDRILQLFFGLAEARNVEFIQSRSMLQALAAYRAGMDFADALHAACFKEGSIFVTFDIDLVKRARQQFSHLAVELAQ